MGRALSQAGQGLQGIAASVMRDRADLDDFQTKMALTRFSGQQDIRQREYDANVAGDGRDHTANRLGEFDASAKVVLDSLPNNPDKRRQAMLTVEGMRARYGEQSYHAQTQHVSQYKVNEITDLAAGQIVPQITGDPNSVRAAMSQFETILGGTDGVSDAQKDVMRRGVAQLMVERWVEQAGPDAKDQAEAFITEFGASIPKHADSPPVPQFSGRASVGSWGDDPTWRSMDKYQKAAAMALLEADARGGRPDITSAKNALGSMLNRADQEGVDLGEHVSGKIYQPTIEPAQYARLARLVGTDDFQVLVQLAKDREAGLVGDWVNGATHFLASEKTMLALERQNPRKYRSWRSWTSFDPETGYAGVIMRDGSHAFLAPNGRHSANFMPTDPRLAEAEGTDIATDVEPQPRAGQIDGYVVRTILANLPQITERSRKHQEEIAATEFVKNAIEGVVPFNGFDEDQRKLVNKAFEKSDVARLLFDGDEPAMMRAVEISQTLNYVPTPVMAAIQGLVNSKDEGKLTLGLRAAAAIIGKQPNAFEAVPGGKEIKKAAEDYAALTGVRGLTPQEAITRIREMQTPEWEAQASARKKEADEFVGELSADELASAFDISYLPFSDPSMPGGQALAVQMLADFKAAAREEYIRHGDSAVAKTLALGQLKRTWGVSSVTGSSVVMKYPPEAVYPKVGDSQEYIAESLTADLKEIVGKDVDLDRVVLRADTQTQREIAKDLKSARYVVEYKDDNGIWQRLPGRWAPDLVTAEAAFKERFETERAEAVKRAEAAEANRKALEAYKPDVLLRRSAGAVFDWIKGKGDTEDSKPSAEPGRLVVP
ncbi:MAG: hypothetical protein AB7S80_19795 [Rhizobiaceae bacterium]